MASNISSACNVRIVHVHLILINIIQTHSTISPFRSAAMNNQLSLILLLIIITYASSFAPLTVRKHTKRLLYNNEFSRNTDPVMNKGGNKNDDDSNNEVLKQKAAQELQERKEVSDSMRNRLLQEIRDGGGDPNFSKGAVAGNPILLISFVIAAAAIASFAIGAI